MKFLNRSFAKNQPGSSLIEIVVATGVMALVLTAILAGLTLSLKTSAESEYRSQAVKRAQEGLEVFRRERTLLGWDLFVAGFTSDSFYCLQTLPAPKTAFLPGACTDSDSIVISGVDFYRQAWVTIDNSDPTQEQMQVTLSVQWPGGDVELVQIFRQWE